MSAGKADKKPIVPAHVAVIMDGNGRWASERGLPRLAGHKAGAEAVTRCLRAAINRGVGYLTLYAFSSENWSREPTEVADLTSLLRYYLRHKVSELHREGVRVRFIGDLARFDESLREELAKAEAKTRDNKRITLLLALSYGGGVILCKPPGAWRRPLRVVTCNPSRLPKACLPISSGQQACLILM
ncbi:di-trans,poly-cis-decaprenylcistransferase [Acetobacter orientalis]|uniref:Di-trans,poly-cis-decaprenylcistransferase n=1 Tax=Acetobacter orientalis TaxID=146474 RepID=A0A2Z5ZFK3_9PROT|nr:di-trans,poly-cis-decaprenylcistransferase [Acetobacter orientalis]